ncbi:MAG: MFS transporter [Pseudomonadota bacterium]
MQTTAAENTGKGINRNELTFVARLSLVSVSRMFGLFMVLPVLAVWVSEFPQATPQLIGIAVGAYGVTQALLQMPYGVLSDKIGRVPVVIMGLTIFAAGSAIVASADQIGGVIIGRLLQGAGAVSATLSAWLADRTRPEVRTPAMAIFGATIGASFLLALVFGPLLSVAIGVRGLFWLSAGLGCFGIALVLPDLGRRALPVATMPAVARVRWGQVLRGDLLGLDLAVLLLHAALLAFFVLAPFVLMERIGRAPESLWQVYTLTLLASLPITVGMIMIDGRARTARLLQPAVALLVIGTVAMAWSGTSIWLFGTGATLFFGGFSYLEAALPAELSRRADPNQRGASLGVFASAQFFGAFVGSTLAGGFASGTAAGDGLIGMAVVLLLWFVVSSAAVSIKSRASGA